MTTPESDMTAAGLVSHADHYIEQVAGNMRAEALGEQAWLESVFNAGPRLSRSIVVNGLRRAAMMLEKEI